mmetsp:Transcript_17740/g.53555  ORF Transcript_17740/g.53555 Transcript_17740/m.53555 type:complete len:226 (+) Transcript_17740:400-1077(+)
MLRLRWQRWWWRRYSSNGGVRRAGESHFEEGRSCWHLNIFTDVIGNLLGKQLAKLLPPGQHLDEHEAVVQGLVRGQLALDSVLDVLRVQRLERKLPARAVVLPEALLERPDGVEPVHLQREGVRQAQAAELLVQYEVVEGVTVVRNHCQSPAAPSRSYQEGHDLGHPPLPEVGKRLVQDDLVVAVVLGKAPGSGGPDVGPLELRSAAREEASSTVQVHRGKLDYL